MARAPSTSDLRATWAALLDLVLPEDCGGCGVPGALWCPDCSALSAKHPPQALPGDGFAAAAHDSPAGRAIVAFKEHGRRALVRPLGDLLAAAIQCGLDDQRLRSGPQPRPDPRADSEADAGTHARPGLVPGIAWPDIARPGIALPEAALPEAALPGAARPGAALLGATPPGIAASGYTPALSPYGPTLVGSAPVWIVPVPARRDAIRKRGFDHTALLAARAARTLRRAGNPAHRLSALRVVAASEDQAGLDQRARIRNVAHTMAAHAIPAGRIVVIDDVTTTGSTLAEAVRAIHATTGRPIVLATVTRPALKRGDGI